MRVFYPLWTVSGRVLALLDGALQVKDRILMSWDSIYSNNTETTICKEPVSYDCFPKRNPLHWQSQCLLESLLWRASPHQTSDFGSHFPQRSKEKLSLLTMHMSSHPTSVIKYTGIFWGLAEIWYSLGISEGTMVTRGCPETSATSGTPFGLDKRNRNKQAIYP